MRHQTARVLRALARRLDPPPALTITVPVAIDGRAVAQAVTDAHRRRDRR
jgi:hypothetical protein